MQCLADTDYRELAAFGIRQYRTHNPISDCRLPVDYQIVITAKCFVLSGTNSCGYISLHTSRNCVTLGQFVMSLQIAVGAIGQYTAQFVGISMLSVAANMRFYAGSSDEKSIHFAYGRSVDVDGYIVRRF